MKQVGFLIRPAFYFRYNCVIVSGMVPPVVREKFKMNPPAPLTFIVDILTFVLGTYGAIILVGEFVELDRFPTPRQAVQILRLRWKAALALLVANLMFFLRLFIRLAQ